MRKIGIVNTANIMRIRTAAADDAHAIASTLHRAFLQFEPLYTPEAFAATVCSIDQIRLRLNEGPIWVALRDGVVVGTASVVPKGDALYIRGMAVDPVARGSGIGCALIKWIEERAIERGFNRLYLSTTPFLVGAIRLYEKCGFVRSADGPDNLFGTPLFAMEKKLGGRARGFDRRFGRRTEKSETEK
jgi:GNAT superfamily N-acetyltransferase